MRNRGTENKGNAENKGEDARNGMGMELWGISVGMPGIWKRVLHSRFVGEELRRNFL